MNWLKADFHCHTTESDGELSPDELILEYEKQGFDVLAISDHDKLTMARSDKLLLIPATEFTYEKTTATAYRHILMFFLETMPSDVEDALRQNSLLYVAHPMTWRNSPDTFPDGIAGVEAVNGEYMERAGSLITAMQANRWKDWRRIYNSDAHQKEDIGQVFTLIQAEKSLDGIRHALLAGRTKLGGVKLGCMAAPIQMIMDKITGG